MNWSEYQEVVADIFRSIGAKVETNKRVAGARGEHDIDVWINLSNFGINTTWICECKLWKTAVPKEKILTLYEITKDIGADKGFLFSESGFQAGALRSAMNTNIILTSISEIKETTQNDFQEFALISLLKQIDILRKYLKASWIDDLGNPIIKNNPYFDDCTLIDGTLMFHIPKIQRALNRDFPITIHTSKKNLQCQNIIEINNILSEEINEIKIKIEIIAQNTKSAAIEIDQIKSSFIISIQNLLRTLEAQLINNDKEMIFETLLHLKNIGKHADNLDEKAVGTLAKEFRRMMSLLIELVYPHLDRFKVDKEEWDNSAKIITHQLNILTEIKPNY